MHPDAELIQPGFEAFAKGDMDTIAGLFSDAIAWHEPGTSPLSGDFQGRDEVFAFLGKLAQITEGTFHQEPPAHATGRGAPDPRSSPWHHQRRTGPRRPRQARSASSTARGARSCGTSLDWLDWCDLHTAQQLSPGRETSGATPNQRRVRFP
jgi:hypothetical protein